MDVKSLKDLEKLAIVCRKRGIAEIKVTNDTLEFKLWDHLPTSPRTRKRKSETQADHVPLEGGYSDEQILSWSVPSVGEN